MSRGDRTIPYRAPQPEPPPRRAWRPWLDGTIVVGLVGLIFSAGIAYKTFLDQGAHLSTHDQEIAQLTQIAQDTQKNMAVLTQRVDDDDHHHGGQ